MQESVLLTSYMFRLVHKILLTLSIILIAVFVGCEPSNSRVSNILHNADNLMSVDPDSAKAILSSVSNTSLRGQQRALHALLMSKAMDKTYDEIYDDSLIKVALEYFDGKGDSLEMQSLFYRGIYLYNIDQYGEALVPLTEAYELAEKNNDIFYSALCARAIGWCYHYMLCVEKDIEWTEKAMELFCRAHRPIHAAWMKMHIADALYMNRDYHGADSLLGDIDSTIYIVDPYLHREILRIKSNILHDKKLYNEAIDAILKYKNLGLPFLANDWIRLSQSYLDNNQILLAAAARDSAINKAVYKRDSLYIDYVTAILYGKQDSTSSHAYSAAMRFGKNILDYSDNTLTHPQTLLINDYLISKSKEKDLLIDQYYLTIVILILGMICLVISVMYMRLRLHEKKLRYESALIRISALCDEISEKNSHNIALKNDLLVFFKKRFSFYNKLGEMSFGTKHVPIENPVFRHRVMSMLKELQDSERLDEIEEMINKYFSNWMKKFRTHLPSLTPLQYKLTIFLFLDFSPNTISILLGKESLNAIYIQKNKLKVAIQQLPKSIAESYLITLNYQI